jgi:hypothetical protein
MLEYKKPNRGGGNPGQAVGSVEVIISTIIVSYVAYEIH